MQSHELLKSKDRSRRVGQRDEKKKEARQIKSVERLALPLLVLKKEEGGHEPRHTHHL
jgi:hypothetical protein